MMTTEHVPDNLAPLQVEDLPPLELLYQRIIALDTGCEIWIGSYHRKTGPFIKYHGRQVQVHRALWFYEYGILPAFHLKRLCEPAACVAVVHRAVRECL